MSRPYLQLPSGPRIQKYLPICSYVSAYQPCWNGWIQHDSAVLKRATYNKHETTASQSNIHRSNDSLRPRPDMECSVCGMGFFRAWPARAMAAPAAFAARGRTNIEPRSPRTAAGFESGRLDLEFGISRFGQIDTALKAVVARLCRFL